MRNIIKLTRPYQWVKNAFIFMPLFFGGAFTDSQALIRAVIAFFAFSFVASSIYCYNDIIDVEDDRRHSTKCKRPIASGAISIAMGYVIMAVMVGLSALMVSLLGNECWKLAGVVGFYFVLEIAYCRVLKRYAIVDVCVLAFGFVLRILAGSAATGIIASQWLVLMTFLLTLLLAFAKRRDDVLKMETTGEAPRHNTHRYNMSFINQSITVTASVTLVCYIMYTMSPEVTSRTNFSYVYLTTIFVILGLLRYMQRTLVDQKTGDPSKLLYEDRFLQIVIAMWLLVYVLIIYIL
ncbi:MAG: decaprenyl-phosphate phosphoribosyltransferase [Prevotellaceae bacterium]|nr:decaprenyl-phosphate phosphoribosyltransferase [Prevotellaceae bacterium]